MLCCDKFRGGSPYSCSCRSSCAVWNPGHGALAGAVPIGSLWLRWLGPSFKMEHCLVETEIKTKGKEEREKRYVSVGQGLWAGLSPWGSLLPTFASSDTQPGCCKCAHQSDKNTALLFNYLWFFWSLASLHQQNKYCNLIWASWQLILKGVNNPTYVSTKVLILNQFTVLSVFLMVQKLNQEK